MSIFKKLHYLFSEIHYYLFPQRQEQDFLEVNPLMARTRVVNPLLARTRVVNLFLARTRRHKTKTGSI